MSTSRATSPVGETLEVPQGSFRLARHPSRDALRAWDAADEYLLNEVAGRSLATLLIVNDGFGALGTALAGARPSVVCDSFLGTAALRENLTRNGSTGEVRVQTSLAAWPEVVDTALVKVPKTLAQLEDQLHRLRGGLKPDSLVVGAGMVRHVHASTLRLFEQIIGPTRTSLARKKARLIYSTFDPALRPGPNPWPTRSRLETGEVVVDHAGVFSAGALDIGTRLLLAHLPPTSGDARVIDLGCGNGLLGLKVALANPQARVVCVDESARAVASAEATFAANGARGEFVLGDCLSGFSPASADLVVNNPPFHAGHALGDATAWQMFTEARAVLKPGGELWVVGNRHLGYHTKLKRLFGACEVAAANPKFVVLRARRSP